MPDLQRQEPVLGGQLEPVIAPHDLPAGTDKPVDSPDESIGEYLRQNRLRMGKTLTEISHALKIMPHQLAAIENNQFEELPGRAYAIGFVRSYAGCLGLDAKVLVTRLRAEMAEPVMDAAYAPGGPSARKDEMKTAPTESGDADVFSAEASPRVKSEWRARAAGIALQLRKTRAVLRFKELAQNSGAAGFAAFAGAGPGASAPPGLPPTQVGPTPGFALFTGPERASHRSAAQERSAPRLSMSPRGLPLPNPPDHPVRTWVTAGVMSAVVMYFGYSIIHSGPQVASPQVTPVPARIAREAGFTPDKIGLAALPVAKKAARRPPAPVTAPAGKDEPPPFVAPAENSAAASREAPVHQQTEAAPVQTASVTPDAKHVFTQLPLGERYGEQNKGSRVTLRLHRPAFVAVLGVRNHQYIDRVLRAGDTYRVPNMRGLKLNTRDAGAVEVILDGNTVGFAGEDGAAVKGMSLQPQNIVSHFHGVGG